MRAQASSMQFKEFSMMLDADIVSIQHEWLNQNRLRQRWIIVQESDGTYSVHHHSVGGVAPPTNYATPRLAASRLLQLLGVGPVGPQDHPEEVCISSATISGR